MCENCHSSLDFSGANDEKFQNDLVIIQPDGSIEENENFENIIPSSIEPEVPVSPKPEVENISPPDIEKSLDLKEEKIDSPRKVSTPPELTAEKNSTAVDRLVINHDSPRNGIINLISCFLLNLFFYFQDLILSVNTKLPEVKSSNGTEPPIFKYFTRSKIVNHISRGSKAINNSLLLVILSEYGVMQL